MDMCRSAVWGSVWDRPRPHRWKSDVNAFPQLDTQTEFGPTYEYEYSTREAYGASIEGWGPNDPLNATWWHHVTEGASVLTYVSRVLDPAVCGAREEQSR